MLFVKSFCSLVGNLSKPLALILLLVLFSLQSIYAQNLTTEDKIKASYVYNFLRFISWPDEKTLRSAQSINVCSISQTNHFYKAFSPVVGKTVKGNPIAIHKIINSKNINHCHLLYMDKTKQHTFETLLPVIKQQQILSVSDVEQFCSQGGIICLVKLKGKISVKINLKAARSAGFKISSNLLEVATIVGND